MAAARPTASSASSLDLLSGVALAHSHELEREERVRAQEVRGRARARYTASSSRAEEGEEEGARVSSSAVRSTAWVPRWATCSSTARSVSFRKSTLARPNPPSSRSPSPPSPRPRSSRPSHPPLQTGLANRPVHGMYMHSDSNRRAVAQLHVPGAPPPAPRPLPPNPFVAPSAPATFPSRMGNPYEAPYAFALPPPARMPASVPMARQPLPLPGGDFPRGRAPLTQGAPSGPSQLALHPQARDDTRILRERRAPPTAAAPQPARRASTSTRAAFAPTGSATAQSSQSSNARRTERAAPAPALVAAAAASSPPRKPAADKAKEDPIVPIVSCTLWEDERTVVMQVLVEGHVVARRADNDWVNSTKLLNMVAGMTRGKRDMYLKNEPERLVFRRGALHLKGVWLPLAAAERLARTYGLYDRLYPLFEDRIKSFLFRPINQERTTQLVRAARGRAALVVKPDISSGLSEDQREELRIRGEALEAMLTELEDGLGLPREDAEIDAGGDEDDDFFSERDASASPTSSRHFSSDDKFDDYAFQPPSPPPTAGLALRQQQEQAGLAASYRTRFNYLAHPAQLAPPHMPTEMQPSTSYLRQTPSTVGHSLSSFSLNAYPVAQRLLTSPHDLVDPPRRPSMDYGFTHDFRQPVAWFDNPTPPEHAMTDYLSSSPHHGADPAAASRRASVSCERAGDLDALVEDEETLLWGGASDALARSRPPVAGAGVLRRLSSDADLGGAAMDAPRTLMWRDGWGRSLSLPPTHRFPTYPLAAPFDAPTLAAPQAVAPAHVVAPNELEPTDYHTLVAQLQASLRTPPSEHAPSPLSRFSATRMSVDSAAELVYPHVGLCGGDSLVAPRSAHVGAGLFAPAGSAAQMQEAQDHALLRELLGSHESLAGGTLDGAGHAIFPSMSASPVVETFAHTSLDPPAALDLSAEYTFPPASAAVAAAEEGPSPPAFALDTSDRSTRDAYAEALAAISAGAGALLDPLAIPAAAPGDDRDALPPTPASLLPLKRSFGEFAPAPAPLTGGGSAGADEPRQRSATPRSRRDSLCDALGVGQVAAAAAAAAAAAKAAEGAQEAMEEEMPAAKRARMEEKEEVEEAKTV